MSDDILRDLGRAAYSEYLLDIRAQACSLAVILHFKQNPALQTILPKQSELMKNQSLADKMYAGVYKAANKNGVKTLEAGHHKRYVTSVKQAHSLTSKDIECLTNVFQDRRFDFFQLLLGEDPLVKIFTTSWPSMQGSGEQGEAMAQSAEDWESAEGKYGMRSPDLLLSG